MIVQAIWATISSEIAAYESSTDFSARRIAACSSRS